MAEVICYANGKYNVYGTISDGFFYEGGLDLCQLQSIIRDEYGENGLNLLPGRLARAHRIGCSAYGYGSLAELIAANRSGDNEKCLSYNECIERFFS